MLRRAIYALLAVLFLGAVLGVWYLSGKGFTKSWRELVAREFRKHGVEISMRRLTLDPFRGLVARDLRLYDAVDRRRTLAVVDQVILGLNYANIWRGEPYLEVLDLRDANLVLPVDPRKPRGQKLRISRLNARLFLPPQQIYLARAEAEIFDFRLYAAGRLINPRAYTADDETNRLASEIMTRLAAELERLRFDGPKPVLRLDFSGDLARPEQISAELQLTAPELRRETLLLREVDLVAAYSGGVVELRKCFARDVRGEIHATGSFDPRQRRLEMRVQSTVDLQAMARAFETAPGLQEYVFYDPPLVEAEWRADFTTDAVRQKLIAQIETGRVGYRSLILESLSGDFSWDGQRWGVHDFRLRHQAGEITGRALSTPQEFRASLVNSIPLRHLQPALDARAAAWLARLPETGDLPFRAEIRGPSADPSRCTIEVTTGSTASLPK